MLALMRVCKIPLPVDPKTNKYSCATKLLKSMVETYPLLKVFYEDKRMIDAIKNLKLEIILRLPHSINLQNGLGLPGAGSRLASNSRT
jgi:hypothetical protein